MLHATHTINLGILAHVDAGKTSLTERLLYEAGAISAPGSVDDGTTRTDSMDIERRRGITVRTNVASFAVGDVQVNLIDTPGHSDFIAEVERSLAVLDAAVLVVSAVEGVQSQTVVLWRALRRLAVPTLIFINKIDRSGADPDRVLAEIGRRLTAPGGVRTLPLTDVVAPGTVNAATSPVPLTDSRVIDVLTMLDDRVLRAALEGPRRQRRAGAALGPGPGAPVPAGAGRGRVGADRLRRPRPAGRAADAAAVGARVGLRAVRRRLQDRARRARPAGALPHLRRRAQGQGPRGGGGGAARRHHVAGTVHPAGLDPDRRRHRRRRRPGPGPRLGHRGRLARPGHSRPGHPPVPAPRARVGGRPGRPRASAAGCSPPCRSWRRRIR